MSNGHNIRCPICKRTTCVGGIGVNRYYCRECCIEFSSTQTKEYEKMCIILSNGTICEYTLKEMEVYLKKY